MMLLLILGIAIIIAGFIWKDRKNIERASVVFVRRTKKGIQLLDRLAKIPGFKTLYTLAVPICFIGVFWIFFLVGLNSYFILVSPEPEPGLAPVIPGIRIPGSPIFIPFWYGILALAILLIVHEGSHGIAARVEKIKVKSTGLLLALVIPGAFVEPDKKEFDNAKPLSRLRVACAGSFANITTAIICILLIMFLLSGVPLRGAILVSVLNETPAAEVFNQSTIITSVNGQKVSDFFEIAEILNTTKPNETVIFETMKLVEGTPVYQSIAVTTTGHPGNESKGFIGIPLYGILTPSTKYFLVSLPLRPISIVKYISPEYWSLSPTHWKWQIIALLKWTAFLNFAIGLVNLLPVLPLDGGLMVQEAVRKAYPKGEKKFMKFMGMIIIFIFLINIWPYFI